MRAGLIPYPPTRVVPVNGARAGFAARARQRYHGAVRQAAAAGEFSHVQLFNPSTSTVYLVVSYIAPAVSAVNLVRIARFTAALATLSSRGLALQFGDRSSFGELRQESNATQLGVGGGAWDSDVGVANRLLIDVNAILRPGEGLGITSAATVVTVGMYVEWSEEPWVEPMPGVERP